MTDRAEPGDPLDLDQRLCCCAMFIRDPACPEHGDKPMSDDSAAIALPDLEAPDSAIDRAFDEVSRICKERWDGKEGWRISIPARPGYDSDLIIGSALLKAREALRSATTPLMDDVVRTRLALGTCKELLADAEAALAAATERTRDAVCGFKFDHTVCVALAGHAGPHITDNERFPHGLIWLPR